MLMEIAHTDHHHFYGAPEEVAEKVVTVAQSIPQALKRGDILNLAARVELVPFPFVEELEFFSSL